MKGIDNKERILHDLNNYGKVIYSLEFLWPAFGLIENRVTPESLTKTMNRIENWAKENSIKYSFNEKSYVYTFSK